MKKYMIKNIRTRDGLQGYKTSSILISYKCTKGAVGTVKRSPI